MADDIASIFRGGALIFFGTVIQMVLGLVGKLLFARYLGPLDFGGLSVGIAIATTGSTILVLGMNKGITRYIPRFDQREKHRSVVSSALQISLPVSIVVSLFIFLGATYIASGVFDNRSLARVIRVFSVSIPILVLYKLSNSVFQGLKRPIPKVLLENIARPVLYFSLIALVIVMGGGVVDASIAYIIPWITVTAVAVLYARYQFDAFSLFSSKSMHAELLVFSLPLVLSVGMQQIFNKVDIFLIGAFASVSEVGIYTAVYPISRMQLVALTATNFVYAPVVSRLDSNSNYNMIEEYYSIIIKWLYLGAVPIVAVFLSHPSWVVTLIFGSEYAAGSTAFAILVIGFFSSLLMGPTANTITSIGDTNVILVVTTSTAVLNIGLNVALIPEFGITGAAIATAVSYTTLNGAYLWFLYWKYELFPVTSKLVVTWFSIPAAVFLFKLLLSQVVDSTVISVLAIFVITTLLSIVAYFVVLDISSEELELLTSVRARLNV